MLKSGTFVSSAMINESVDVTLKYTLFPPFSHCTKANVIWILTEFLATVYYIRSLSDIKNRSDNQELPP